MRLVIAEDSMLMREGIKRVLELGGDLSVVAAVEDLPQLLAAVEEHRPDVVVTDVRMPPTSTDEGIRAAAELRGTHPDLGVVVLSQYAEPGYASVLLEGGSAGRAYLLKDRVSEPGQLVAAVHAVRAGGSVLDPTVVDVLVKASTKSATSPLQTLTAREREVLEQIATGRSNAAVGEALFLTERAVEKHINALFTKLGLGAEPDVNRRVKAVLLYLSERDGSTGSTR